MEKKIKLLMTTMPNFIAYEINGKKASENISVADLTKEEADQYGQEMAKAFVSHWERKKADTKDYNPLAKHLS